jgi:hypothetical protein
MVKAVLTSANSMPKPQSPVRRKEQEADAFSRSLRCCGKIRFEGKTKKWLVWMLASTAGIVGLWQVYHSQVSSGFDLFPGPRGDTRLSAYLIEHWYQVLLGRADWLSPAMFYPVKGTLGFSDLYLAYVPLYSLLRLGGYDTFLALSLTVIVLCYLNFIACFGLLNKVLGFSAMASCAGAMFFAFNNPKLAQSDHLQLQPVLLLPIIAALVILFFLKSETLSAKTAFGLLASAALCLNLQLLTSFYIGWFSIFWCVLFLALSCSFRRSRNLLLARLRRHPAAVTGAAVVFVVTLVPFLVVYLPAAFSVQPYGVLPQYIPEMKSYLLMADGNYIWGAVTDFILRQAGSGPDWGRRIGIGLVPSVAWIAISVFGLWAIKQLTILPTTLDGVHEDDQRGNHAGYLFLGLMVLATNLLMIIGLQYQGHSLWNYVYLSLPGAKAARAVARYTIVLTLPLAIAFAFIVQRGIQSIATLKSGVARLVLAAAMFAVTIFGLFEQLNSGEGQYFSISAEKTRLEKLAATLPGDCSAFYVAAGPLGPVDRNAFEDQQYMHDAMLVSEIRNVPTLNGRSGKSPPGWSLRNVRASDYELNVRRWIERNNIKGNVCRLEVND